MMSSRKVPGCFGSVSQGFEENDACEVRGSRQEPFHIKTLVFLHKLEMNPLARGEAFEVFTSVPTSLVFKVLGLQEGEFAFPLQDASVETIEEVAVAPFADKRFR